MSIRSRLAKLETGLILKTPMVHWPDQALEDYIAESMGWKKGTSISDEMLHAIAEGREISNYSLSNQVGKYPTGESRGAN